MSFFDIYYQPGENPVFCYRSGMAVYEEILYKGVLMAGGYNAAGYPLDVLSNCDTRLRPETFQEPSVFQIELNGQSLEYGLRFVNFETFQDEETIEAVLTLDSENLPVRLLVHTILDGTQMFTRYIEIENRSQEYLNLNKLVLLSGGLEVMGRRAMTAQSDINKLYSAGYFDATSWGHEGDFAWHDVQPGVQVIESRYNRDRYRHPVVFLRNNVKGTIFYSQIGWSGGCRYTVDYNAEASRDESQIALKAEITSYNPMRVIEPGESYMTPEVYMGVIAGDLDDAINDMHAHIRQSVLNMPEADGSACYVGAGMGAEHDMSVETTKAFMRQMSEMGAEIFIIDAGWECPPEYPIDWPGYNGMNVPDADRYPNGIDEVIDYCHSLGMQFALWVEIERLGEKSGVFREHPEWIARDLFGNSNGGYLDMTQPEAAAWAERELTRIITEYKMDLLRVDYNVSNRNYFAIRDAVPGHRECLSLRHFDAVYKMYQKLKRKFPNVIFENCAGGGGRTDLGMMKSFNHTWVSDWQKAPRSVAITNGMTMALPPERVDRLFAGMGCHEFGSFAFHMRNTMLTHMSVNVVAPAATIANPLQMEFVKQSVGIYKDFIRPFLPESKIYHHTPAPSTHCVLEVTANDQTRGVIGVFAMAEGADRIIVKPKGLDIRRNYRITLDNSGAVLELRGYELAMQGLAVELPSSMASELILYESM